MNEKFDNLEDIFADLNEEKAVMPINENMHDIKPQINSELIKYYSSNPGLLEGDIESGIIPIDIANDLRNIVYAYPEIEKDNPPLVGTNNTESKGKTKVKSTKAGKLLHQSYDLGFAETLLLGLVVSSIGFVYLCYLYLVI